MKIKLNPGGGYSIEGLTRKQVKRMTPTFHQPTLHDLIPVDGIAEMPEDVLKAIAAGLKPMNATITKNGVTVPVQVYQVDDNGLVWGTK